MPRGNKMFVLDSHCDTPSQILRLRDLAVDNEYAHIDFPKLKKSISKENLSELKKIPECLEAIKGPAICFHDIQGFNVSAKEIQIKNSRFSCKLIFNFYDHFGLDSRDIDKFGDNSLVGKGFQAWYILQHLYEYKTGCKAFVTHATHEEPVEVEIEE